MDVERTERRGLRILTALLRLLYPTLCFLIVFGSVYWTVPQPGSIGSLLSAIGRVWIHLGIITALFFLFGLPPRLVRVVALFVWPNKEHDNRRRVDQLLESRALGRMRVYLRLFLSLSFSIYGGLLVAQFLNNSALICESKHTGHLRNEVSARCFDSDPLAVCKVAKSEMENLPLHIRKQWRDPLGRPYVTERSKDLPLTPNIPIGLLADTSNALLFTSDHEEGRRNVEQLQSLAEHVLKSLPISDLMELDYDSRYSEGIVNAIRVIHYWLWAKSEAAERSGTPATEYETFLGEEVAGYSAAEVMDFLATYAEGIDTPPGREFSCDGQLMKRIDPLRFLYLRAYYEFTLTGRHDGTVRLFELGKKLVDASCNPSSMRGFWYIVNMCLYTREDRPYNWDHLCSRLDTLSPKMTLFLPRCGAFAGLGEVLDAVEEYGEFSCPSGESADFALAEHQP